jgi:hypothetical protein
MAQARVGTQCPECGRRLRLDPQLIGTTVRCPACRKTFVVSTVSFAESSGPGKSSTGRASGTNTAGGTPASVPEAELSLEAYGTRMVSGDSAETFAGKKSGSGELSTSMGKIGRFEVHEVLGRGAFGVVSRAYDRLLDRQVALKVPLFSSKDGKRARRFLNEAKAAASLRHPNIVAVYEGGEADGKLYLAAEYIKGQTLAEVIKSARSAAEQNAGGAAPEIEAAEHHGRGRMPHLLPIEQSVRWVRELAGALAYAHAQGVVHRDIKPHNVMIDAEGRPQIMDFGLAKRVDQDSKMTSEGALLGTPAYMPPEQARGDIERIGPHSDQYSLGTVLYELLTGKRPFDGTPAAVTAKAASEEPPAPRTINSEIPEDLEAICRKAMEKDPARRYVNCIALAADLANWEQGEATAARPLSSMERAKRWAQRSPAIAGLVLTVAALLVLAAGGSAVGAFVLSRSNQEHAAALTAARERTEKAAAQAEKAAAAARRAEEGTREAEAETQRAEEAREEHERVIASFDEATKKRVLKEEELKGIREERKKTGSSAAGKTGNTEQSPETQLATGIDHQANASAADLAIQHTARFFDITAKGQSIVYVVDCSGSMFGKRFDRAKKELIRSVRALNAQQNFYIIFFNDRTFLLFDPKPVSEMVSATAADKQHAEKWIKAQKAESTTNPNRALRHALELKPDVIFLLTDGEMDDPTEVQRVIRESNPAKVVIHAIALENQEGARTLESIANDNGGEFRFVK